MRIVFLALAYPDISKTSNLYTDLMQEFGKKGHDVLVVAPSLSKDDSGLKNEGAVKVLRVRTMQLFRVGIIQKGIANVLLPYQYKKAIKKNKIGTNFDLILIPTPPITLISTAVWLRKKAGAKLYLILRDIFPQNAVDLGMMKHNGFIYNYFRKKEKQMYRACDSIGCMSQGNIDYVIKHNPDMDASKLHLLPNWARISEPASKEDIDQIKEQYQIQDKFVVLFGGNIGKPQKLENIVALAKHSEDIKDLLFFIIGYGTEKERIRNLVAKYELKNMVIYDSIPRSDYYKLTQAADVGLISLNENFTIPNIPSKTLSYFGTKKPILASLDVHTDLGSILEEINAGVWAEAGKTEELKQKLLLLYKDEKLRKQMGENGYAYKKEFLQPEHAYNTIMRET